MMTRYIFIVIAVFATCLETRTAQAEVISAAPDHYTLRQSALSEQPPEKVWKRLINPAQWWQDDHTYSGDAENLRLNVNPGGLWREDWADGAVTHGEVIFIKNGEMLRLNAPFGPLQDRAVTVVWTITLKPEGSGTRIIFDEVANGTAQSGLDALAPAVDFVKSEALKSLTKF